MPEYLALVHHRNQTDGSDESPPPTIDEVNAGFMRMARMGIAKVVH